MLIKIVIFCFLLSSVSFAQPSSVTLPKPGSLVELSIPINPIVLKGLKLDLNNPFRFDFILSDGGMRRSSSQLKEEGMRQVSYFLAALTFKPGDLWVNLSPYEKDRIIAKDLEKTALGRDLLVQDYILKQLASSLTHPNGAYGKLFWKKVYETAGQHNVKNIPLNTFNKIWITPDFAQVYSKGNAVVVTKMHLKVMVEEDYLASIKNVRTKTGVAPNDPSIKAMREVLVPLIEKEVNNGEHFLLLRQVVNAAILAEWYKRHLKETLIAKEYINKSKVAGIDDADASNKEALYEQYLKAYKQGVYNLIKEENQGASHEVLPRKYFAGGVSVDLAMMDEGGDAPPGFEEGDYSLRVVADNRVVTPKNPYLLDMIHRLEALRVSRPELSATINYLLSNSRRITKGWEDINGNSFYHVRDARSDALGTPKGGIRYVTAKDLNKDEHFTHIFNEFLLSDPNEQSVKQFIEKWIDEETKALALAMTLKTAGTGLKLGGAKATVFIGNIVKVDGKWAIRDWNWEGRKYLIARLHARRLTKAAAVGISIDSPAPDMRTNPKMLEVYNDEYLRVLTEAGPQSFGPEHAELYRRLERELIRIKQLEARAVNNLYRDRFPNREQTPFLKVTYDYWNKGKNTKNVPWLGVFTGKSIKFGGAPGRTEATGRGVIKVLKTYYEVKKEDYRGKTISIQAFGNVGRYSALYAAQAGFKVEIISDNGIVLRNANGWSEEALKGIISYLESKRNATLRFAWESGQILRQGVDAFLSDESLKDNDKIKDRQRLFDLVMYADVDVLIPAFKEDVIEEEQAPLIKAKLIIEAANGPVTPEAKSILLKRGIEVIPDTLANAGGVSVSGFEMERAQGRIHFPEEADDILGAAARQVFNESVRKQDPNHTRSFDAVAMTRLRDALSNSSLAMMHNDPTVNGGIDINTSQININQIGQPPILIAQDVLEGNRVLNGLKPVFIELKPINLSGWLDQ